MEIKKEVKVIKKKFFCDKCKTELGVPLYLDKRNDLYVYVCDKCEETYKLKYKYPVIEYI